jgi:hypothetical protein
MIESLLTQMADHYSDSFRYERKMVSGPLGYDDVNYYIQSHPSCFSTQHPNRTINNLYFDTLNWDFFQDAEAGVSHRMKVRLRWYGPFNCCENALLEFKVKHNMLGKKYQFYLKGPFDTQSLTWPDIYTHHHKLMVLKDSIPPLQPILFNHYQRSYFSDESQSFRLTTDSELWVSRHLTGGSSLPSEVLRSTIIELKYDASHDNQAQQLTQSFPFLVTKQSKYVDGVHQLLL